MPVLAAVEQYNPVAWSGFALAALSIIGSVLSRRDKRVENSQTAKQAQTGREHDALTRVMERDEDRYRELSKRCDNLDARSFELQKQLNDATRSIAVLEERGRNQEAKIAELKAELARRDLVIGEMVERLAAEEAAHADTREQLRIKNAQLNALISESVTAIEEREPPPIEPLNLD